MPTEILLLIGDTQGPGTTETQTTGNDIIRDILITSGNLLVEHTSTPIRNYRLQATSNPLDANPAWANAAAITPGIHSNQFQTHAGGATGSNRIYRIIAIP